VILTQGKVRIHQSTVRTSLQTHHRAERHEQLLSRERANKAKLEVSRCLVTSQMSSTWKKNGVGKPKLPATSELTFEISRDVKSSVVHLAQPP
jgi:hypothetical protein